MNLAIALHAVVIGTSPVSVEVSGRTLAWADLSMTHFDPGKVTLRFDASGVDAIEIPPCAGRGRVSIDGVAFAPPPGTFVVKSHGKVEIEIDVSSYEQRIACGYAPRLGKTSDTREGLSAFASGVVFVPSGHDWTKPSPALVGLHPWDGSAWTYAAYAELLAAAQKNDVVLLFPNGLGNSLYTRAAELEVIREMDALAQAMAIDLRRVSIWGASMGGAGATTIGFHRPDRFASITSLFGDSKYDLATYVKSILPTAAAAHAVDSLDLAPNARHVPVWLIHGDADRVSPIVQSSQLADALTKNGYTPRFDRIANAGHSGALVAKNAAEIVQHARAMISPEHPSRVTFASARDEDVSAYGVRIVRAGPGDAFVDIELASGAIRVISAKNVKEIVLAKGALGSVGSEPITGASVRFE